MNERLKKILEEIESMSPAQRAFKASQIEESMEKMTILEVEFMAGIANVIMSELGVERSSENASKIYPMIKALISFRDSYHENDPDLMVLLFEALIRT